jgi:hypothetical protein
MGNAPKCLWLLIKEAFAFQRCGNIIALAVQGAKLIAIRSAYPARDKKNHKCVRWFKGAVNKKK